MPLHPPSLSGNVPARSGHPARACHVSGCDTVEPLDVFPQYSDALQRVANEPLPALLLQDEAPPPLQEPRVPHGRDPWSHLRRSIYNNPRPHAVQQAREVEDAFDTDLFIHPPQPLNPDNPDHAAAAPLDSDSLHRYHALGMAAPCAETRHGAELLSMGDDECVLMDAVRAYVASETHRHVEGAQDFDSFQIITYTPVPAADPAPPRSLLWLDGGGAPAAMATGSENQVVLCASNVEDAQPPAWAPG